MLTKDVIVIGKKRLTQPLSLFFLALIAIVGLGVSGYWIMIAPQSLGTGESNLAAAIIPTVTPPIVTNGLVGYWKLNEVSGTSVADSSGSNITGTFNGGTITSTPGVNGIPSISFNGSQYVDFGNALNLGNNSLTLAVRVDPSSLPAKGDMNVFSRRVANGGVGYQVNIFANGSIAFASFNNGTWNICSTAANSIPANAWTHIAATFDQTSNQATVYVKGQVSKTCTFTTGVASDPSGDLRLAYGFDSQDVSFSGAMNDLRVYNRVLSASEVSQVYSNYDFSMSSASPSVSVVAGNSVSNTVNLSLIAALRRSTVTFSIFGLPSGASAVFSPTFCTPNCSTSVAITTTTATPAGTYPLTVVGNTGFIRETSFNLVVTASTGGGGTGINAGLVADWGFAEGSGTTISDSSGNGVNGTLINGTFVTGVDGGHAISFSGNGYVDFGNALNLGNSSLTLIAWVKPAGQAPTNQDFNILSRRIPSGVPDYQIDLTDQGAIEFWSYNGGWNGCSTGSSVVPTGAWTNVALTFNQSGNQAVIYINGQPSKTCTLPASLASNSGALLRLGYGFASDDHDFNGAIDNTRIYNRALAQSEVNQLYSGITIVPPPSFSFSLSPANASVSVTAGNTASNAINAALTSGTAAPVSFSVSGFPSGVTGSFTSSSCTPTCSTTLNISTTASTAAGSFPVTVTGTSGNTTQTASFTLNIGSGVTQPPPSFDFSLSSMATIAVTAGTATSNTVNATLVSGTAASVSFTVSGLPSGVTSSFTKSSCNPTCSTVLSITTTASTAAGNYPITVTGTNGSTVHTTPFTLTVNPVVVNTPPFSFSLSPTNSSVSVTAGNAASNAINAALTTGTAAPVAFSVSGLPSGASGSFTASSCTPACSTTLNMSTSASTPAGSYTTTISGVSGTTTQNTTFGLNVSGSGGGTAMTSGAEEFDGPFSNWIDITKAPYNADPSGNTDDTNAIQTALTNLGDASTIYFPAGTYPVSKTLTIVNKTGFNLIGQDPRNANTSSILKWTGTSGGTLLLIDGVVYGRFSRLVFNGSGTAGIAVDESMTSCSHIFDDDEIYADDIFENAGYGLRGGDYQQNSNSCGFADVEVLRSEFLNDTTYGLFSGNYNALTVEVRDSYFQGNAHGLGSQSGNFSAINDVFNGSTGSDIHFGGAEYFMIRDNYSSGSNRFIDSDNNGTYQITLQNNTIVNTSQTTAVNLPAGNASMVIGNTIVSKGTVGPAVTGSGQAIFYNNTFTVSNPISFGSNGYANNVRTIPNPQTVTPGLTPPVRTFGGFVPQIARHVINLTGTTGNDSNEIQSAVNTSCAQYNGAKPVVHLPAKGSNYVINSPIIVPADCDVQIIGDGPAPSGTQLFGGDSLKNQASQYMFELKSPSHAILKNMFLNGNYGAVQAILIDGVDQSGASVYIQKSGCDYSSGTCFNVNGLDRAKLELEDTGFGDINAGTVGGRSGLPAFNIVGGPDAAKGIDDGGRVNIFGGSSGNDYLQYSVSNGGRLLVQDYYTEEHQQSLEPGFLRITGNSTVTLQSYRIASSVNQGLNTIDISNFSGKATILNTEPNYTYAISGSCSGGQFLAGGTKFFTDSGSTAQSYYANNANPACTNAASILQSYGTGGTTQVADTGTVSDSTLVTMLGQTVANNPERLTTELSPAVTDARLYDIFIQNAYTGVNITPSPTM